MFAVLLFQNITKKFFNKGIKKIDKRNILLPLGVRAQIRVSEFIQVQTSICNPEQLIELMQSIYLIKYIEITVLTCFSTTQLPRIRFYYRDL